MIGRHHRARSIRGRWRAEWPLIAVVALCTTTACFGYRPIETAPRTGARVQIVLLRASTITTVSTAGAMRTATGVIEARGTIESIAPDTVALVLGELSRSSGRIRTDVGTLALLPTDRIARFETERFRAVKTAVVGVGLVALFLYLRDALDDAFVFLP